MILVAAALAQTVGGAPPPTNGQLFRPSIDSTHTLWTDDASRAPDGYFLARGLAHYTRDPVIYETPSGDVQRIIGDLFQLSILAGYTKGPVRLGIDVPVFLRNIGDAGGETGIGDISVDVKGTLLNHDTAALGLALGGRATIPTSTMQGPLGGKGFGWELQGIVDKPIGDLLLTANLGFRGVPTQELENFTWGNQFIARLGGGYALSPRAGISVDAATHINLAQVTADSTPVEALLGGWYGIKDVVLRAGVGTGLTQGFGSPSLRLILGIAYEPTKVRDRDGDGIVDSLDACPDVPEDLDDVRDEDGCAEPTLLLVLIQDPAGSPINNATFHLRGPADAAGNAGDEVPLFGGDYQIDLQAPGYLPIDDAPLSVLDAEHHHATFTLTPAVVRPTLTVRVVNPEGAEISDAEWTIASDEPYPNGASDTFDIGTYRIRSTAPGYRPKTTEVTLNDSDTEALTVTLSPAKVEVTAERIDIKESVYFETAKDVIKEVSYELLNEVAQIIIEHPELKLIRIEGHTDSRGNASYNLRLSRARAASVQNYLIERGVEAARLQSEGYGESRPITRGNNEAAWSKNRRVDFFVAERSDD